MMIASTARNAAAANIPTPVPPALKLIFSSDFASWISFWISVEMSRLASWTRRPMVGSPSFGVALCTWFVAMRVPLLVAVASGRLRPYRPRVGPVSGWFVAPLVDVGDPVVVGVALL